MTLFELITPRDLRTFYALNLQVAMEWPVRYQAVMARFKWMKAKHLV